MQKEDSILWEERAVQSEIELSKAYGGIPQGFSNFIHIYNKLIPLSGDFNRAIGVKLTDFQSFNIFHQRVLDIHIEKKLDKPSRYDVYPPVLDVEKWNEYLQKKNCILSESIFMSTETTTISYQTDISFYKPSESEYMNWFYQRMKAKDYFDTEWYEQISIPQAKFIQVFKPLWLMIENEIIGWVYCANFGDYCRLFDVEIVEAFRGKGYGGKLMDMVKFECGREGASHIIVQPAANAKKFYEKIGFVKRASCSTIWVR